MNKDITIPHQSIHIRDGKVVDMGDQNRLSAPKNAVVIDGNGKYIMPGLFDMHAHFFYEQGDNINSCEKELKTMLANGLTTTRIMAGHPAYLEAREKVKQKEWIGPELFIASPQFVGRWPWPPAFKNYEIADSPEKAVSAVKEYKALGYDAIKLTFMLTREVFDAVIKSAKAEGIKVVGHVGPGVRLTAALASGMQIEHMDEFIDQLLPDTSYNHGQSVSDMNIWRKSAWITVPFLDESKLAELVSKVKRSGIYVTPTNHFFISSFGEGRTEEEIRKMPDYSYIPSHLLEERWQIRERYNNLGFAKESRERYVYLRKKMVKELWKAGVPLMAGSDSPEWFLVTGFSIHDELETFVKAGLTPYAALQTATVHPATYLGIINRTGTVETGKEADLVLLDSNPLENIKNTRSISGVFASG
ncbi:MAG: amidohydrolase family protein, partial [Chitinophagaceae bacterium]|nr:amidohydrolase family protein [Chitinophagaceae bacterium]